MRVIETIGSHQNGHFSYRFDALVEDSHPRDHFDDDDETVEAILNGELEWFTVRGSVSIAGTHLAEDYLGGCCYRTTSDFLKDDYFEDMVHQLEVKALAKLEELRIVHDGLRAGTI
jgi:hypothetical protein